MAFKPDPLFPIMRYMTAIFISLGLHPRLIERPLQGRGLILSGLKGRLYKPRPTAWVWIHDYDHGFPIMRFMMAIFISLGFHPRLIKRHLQGR